MTQEADRAGPRRQYGWLAASLAAAALILGGATFYTAQRLSRDDCTTVTTTAPDGSQVRTETCS